MRKKWYGEQQTDRPTELEREIVNEREKNVYSFIFRKMAVPKMKGKNETVQAKAVAANRKSHFYLSTSQSL